MKQVSPCPKCRRKIGWHILREIEEGFNENGEPIESGDGKDPARKTCRHCGFDITPIIK